MPELPEVENVCRSLQSCVNMKIHRVESSNKKLRIPLNDMDLEPLRNCNILSITRRAKYLIFTLSNHMAIVAHLGMSGKFVIQSLDDFNLQKEAIRCKSNGQKHYHMNLYLLDENYNKFVLSYEDPRRFGLIMIVTHRQLNDLVLLNSIPMDAIDSLFTAQYLFDAIKQKKSSIKQVLLTQQIVGGIGNIYACEALFLANIHPTTVANQMTKNQCEKLVTKIKTILQVAIDSGGSTLKDYQNAIGKKGSFQNSFNVYGRIGLPCVNNCSSYIEKITQNQRSTFLCNTCQK